jgi:MFS family permease
MKTAHTPAGPVPGEGRLLENQAAQMPGPSGALTREILAPAAVVVLGAIMTILDATIVNVALPSLGRDLYASIPVIQWVPTVYLLAFAAVIPLTGWAAARFGAKTVWLASLGLFMTGSLLAGLSASIGALTSIPGVRLRRPGEASWSARPRVSAGSRVCVASLMAVPDLNSWN